MPHVTKRYIAPPRPMKAAIPFSEAGHYQSLNWAAQLKFNEHHLIWEADQTDLTAFNRHGKKASSPPAQQITAEFQALLAERGINGWNVFDGGHVYGKHPLLAGYVFLWDWLVQGEEWKLGTGYLERYKALRELASNRPFAVTVGDQEFVLGIHLTDHVIIPENFSDHKTGWKLVEAVNEAVGWKGSGEPPLEGLVFKDPTGKYVVTDKSHSIWMARSRVRTGRHGF